MLGDGLADRVRDLWDTWRHDPRFGLAVLVAVAVVAGVLWYRIGASGGSAAPTATPRPATTSPPRTASDAGTTADTQLQAATEAKVVVHVAGAVQRPGVVELAAGSRVIDAVESAGGGLPEADLDRLNLAAKLADGERVLVQRVGDPPVAETAVPGSASGTGPGGATTGLVNLNTATTAQLAELPGIGPVLAEAIVTERDRRGGFRSVNEVRDVRGIGEKRFADLADLVTV